MVCAAEPTTTEIPPDPNVRVLLARVIAVLELAPKVRLLAAWLPPNVEI